MSILYQVFCIIFISFSLQACDNNSNPIKGALPAVVPITEPAEEQVKLPDFFIYKNVKDKKQAFFSFLYPLVTYENQRIRELRSHLSALKSQSSISIQEREWLQGLAAYYEVKLTDDKQPVTTQAAAIETLLSRVDEIPASLALAQAANESAWGTSRFAVQGNNLFGQWCFSQGCGLVPKGRVEGATHEVSAFKGPRESVQAYIHNLNTNRSYSSLRTIRSGLRQNQKNLSGASLAEGLELYSARGKSYTEELKSMIRINKLTRFEMPE
jgi:Bax protein